MNSNSTMEEKYDAALQYRELQVMNVMCSKCLQDVVFPLAYYASAFCTITCSFLLITFREKMNVMTALLLLICAVGFMIVSGFLLELGSKPMRISNACVSKSKRTWGNCAWSKRFYRSCRPVVLKIGSFARVDKKVFPNLIKIVIHRTTALVVKNKTSEIEM